MAKTNDEELPDLYELLDVPFDAGEKDIQRAFRKQAIKYHPDKNPSESAAKRFHLLTIALDLLTSERRATYDATRTAKVEATARREKMEGERRAWIDALEKSEAEVSMMAGGKRKRELTREEQLAREGAELRAAMQRDLLQKMAPKGDKKDDGTNKDNMSASDDHTGSGYSVLARFRGRATSAAELQKLFARYGDVMEVIYRPSTNKTQSALIEFRSASSAQRAAEASIETLSQQSGLDFRQLSMASSSRDDTQPHKVQEQTEQAVPRKAQKVKPVESLDTPVIGSSYESSILQKMRQRQREKVAAQAVN